MRTIAYIDGFNLYRRLLKNHNEAKWLNLEALVKKLLSEENDLIAINYYTADLSGKFDTDLPIRQRSYLKALGTLDNCTIHKGLFKTNELFRRLARPVVYDNYCPLGETPNRVKVINQKEKGSDVNLGVHLVRDGFIKAYDVAVVLTNDSDLAEPIRIVTQEIGLPVGVLCPDKIIAGRIKKYSTFIRHIELADAKACQFPDKITEEIQKPSAWDN